MSDWLPMPSTETSKRLRVAARAADGDRAAAVGEALHAALEHLPADRVDDEVDAAPAGEVAHLVDPVVAASS